MVVGVVYKYTDPDGKVYIGQTTNECHRRGSFFLYRQVRKFVFKFIKI